MFFVYPMSSRYLESVLMKRENSRGSLVTPSLLVVYYESMKRKLLKPMHECRCNGRLQTKRFTRLAHTPY
jgi:hypothetical protein